MSTVKASHILLMFKGSMRSSAQRSRDEAKTLITDLSTQLADGADFAGLAKAHSDCPSSRSGGDLGIFGKGQMVPRFEQEAFGLEVGATRGVIETDFGFHIIQRTG